MTPTNDLRFIEREVYGHTIRILQQKWIRPVEEQTTFATGSQVTEEWIDVPVVRESATPDIDGHPV